MQDQILIGKLDRVTGLNPDKAGFPIQFVLLFRTLSYSVLPYLFIFSSVLVSWTLSCSVLPYLFIFSDLVSWTLSCSVLPYLFIFSSVLVSWTLSCWFFSSFSSSVRVPRHSLLSLVVFSWIRKVHLNWLVLNITGFPTMYMHKMTTTNSWNMTI